MKAAVSSLKISAYDTTAAQLSYRFTYEKQSFAIAPILTIANRQAACPELDHAEGVMQSTIWMRQR
jgi:hypothetical protein